MRVLSQVTDATRRVLREPSYLFSFFVLIPVLAFLLLLIPVLTIPGNDFLFQLGIMYESGDYILLVPMVALESLLIVMFFYLSRASQRKRGIDGLSGAGVVSMIPAFLFGMKLCPLCLSAIFAALGLGAGSVLPILEYRLWFFSLSFAVILLSLQSVSRKIVSHHACERC